MAAQLDAKDEEMQKQDDLLQKQSKLVLRERQKSEAAQQQAAAYKLQMKQDRDIFRGAQIDGAGSAEYALFEQQQGSAIFTTIEANFRNSWTKNTTFEFLSVERIAVIGAAKTAPSFFFFFRRAGVLCFRVFAPSPSWQIIHRVRWWHAETISRILVPQSTKSSDGDTPTTAQPLVRQRRQSTSSCCSMAAHWQTTAMVSRNSATSRPLAARCVVRKRLFTMPFLSWSRNRTFAKTGADGQDGTKIGKV